VATAVDAQPAITPDQAPVASFTATAGAAGAATSFDASASKVAYGTISSYAWSFGDGSTATTSTPTVTHTYAARGSYTATLTETDSAGTSTTQVFTGQTMSRNGGPSAQTTRAVAVASALPAVSPVPVPPPKLAPASSKPSVAPVVIASSSGTVTSRGDAVIAVSCPATAVGGCRGTITLQLVEPASRRDRARAARCGRGCRKLGSAEYQARAGQSATVRVHLASFGRQQLARHKTLRVTVITRSVSGARTTTSVSTITLRARKRSA
jgi:PKD repeat protein